MFLYILFVELSDGETVFLHNEISSIIDRLTSPSKNKPNVETSSDTNSSDSPSNANMHNISDKNRNISTETAVDKLCHTNNEATVGSEVNDEQTTVNISQQDFIEEMQTENATIVETTVLINVDKFRQMIPYNTTDPEKISQQESILELLISNGICNDETFQIFITEPDLHKEKASQILDSLYCVNTMMPIEYENDGAIEWVNSVESLPIAQTPDSIAFETNLNSAMDGNSIQAGSYSPLVVGDAPILGDTIASHQATSK